MATIRIPASNIYSSGTQYMSSDIDNAYTNVDSSTYATFTGTTSTYKNLTIYFYDFDLTLVPSDAIVTGFDIKVKYELVGTSGSSQATRYRFKNSSSAPYISKGTGTTTGLIKTFDNIASDDSIITWSDIVNNENTSGTTPAPSIYFYYSLSSAAQLRVYGMEIDVYTWEPTSHGIFNLILPAKEKL